MTPKTINSQLTASRVCRVSSGTESQMEAARRHGVDGEQHGREEQPAADVPVDRRPAQAERRHQKRDADDHADRHAELDDPLPEGGRALQARSRL